MLMDKKMSLDLYYVETMSNINKFDESCDELQQIQKRLSDFPNHYGYFVLLCYNIGVKLYGKEKYDYAIIVLETALRLEKDSSQKSHDRFAILKLLTHIFLIYKPEYNWVKCLKVISLWKKGEIPVSILLTSLKAAFFSNKQNTVQDILYRFLEIEDISVFQLSIIVQELEINGYEKMAADFLKTMRERTDEVGDKLYLMSLELKIYFGSSYLEKANILIEEAIKLVKFQDITPKQSNSLYRVLLTYTNDLLKAKSFMQCLTWCKKLLKIFELTKMHDVFHQIQQRICLCYLELNENELAKQTFVKMDMSVSDSDSFQTYLTLRIAIQCEDEELADTALKSLGSGTGGFSFVLELSCRAAICFPILKALDNCFSGFLFLSFSLREKRSSIYIFCYE
ncbi:uncharacterized protein NPIL_298201 [Nephila pilipes]|uniref:Protein ZIP4 homolog n=1 Tax=Nephila pilipes TaxID=299642 RepID=A0A8X6Q245_NEPPI|nr:uncharacterized protein NPIL_298201 [Nephila pilipes]